MSKIKYFNKAALAAEKSPLNCQHGAIIVNKGRVCGTGVNIGYSLPFGSSYGKSAHAEYEAVLNATHTRRRKGILCVSIARS